MPICCIGTYNSIALTSQYALTELYIVTLMVDNKVLQVITWKRFMIMSGLPFTIQSHLLATVQKKPFENIEKEKEQMQVCSIFSLCRNALYLIKY